jgi:RNA polymerase sigma-70 factor (ECF subfamily)
MPEPRTIRFDTLVAPHMEMLLRVAHRLTRNPHDAQDLVQDACVAACEHPADIEASTHPVRWLLRVLHNRFIDLARRHRRNPLLALEEVGDDTSLVSDQPGPEQLQEQADDERAFVRAFLQLDAVQRTLLTLRAEGHDLAEIEAVTGIDREVLRGRLHRARRSLARYLTDRDAWTQVRAGSNP